MHYSYPFLINRKIVMLNTLNGDIKVPEAKIAPFKVMRGKQIYDSQNNYLIVPKLFGEGGYWKVYDWNLASQLGMKEVNLPYSGSYADGRLDWKALGYSGDPMKVKGRKFN